MIAGFYMALATALVGSIFERSYDTRYEDFLCRGDGGVITLNLWK